ncbi:unnamed protein product [Rotaria sp. Silwood2]|nr:unnamed protein product [Rotaria sp. Silwood2]CAF4318581.1 unnamed protein product [Rotaria sp. Silwood2]
MADNNDDDDFSLNSLFSSIEKAFPDFDRLFSGFSTIFSIPSQDFNNENPRSSTSLRDEVLKQDVQKNHHDDENLDFTTEKIWF